MLRLLRRSYRCVQRYIRKRDAERRTFIVIGSARATVRRRVVRDVPRQTPHFHDYQWSSAGVVIQFAAVPTMTTQTDPSVSSTVLPPPLLNSSICCQMALMLLYAICSTLHAAKNDCRLLCLLK